jgi:protease-4
MTTTPDAIIDRQHLKRHLTAWRVIAIGALVLAASVTARPTGSITGQHIERYRIAGLIGDGNTQVEELTKLGTNTSVAAIVLHLDTPGGQVTGGEGIYAAVKDLAAKKPVVVVMDGTAASAGYMIAVAAPHIIARESTITGSIGVIMENFNVGGLLDKLGVSVDPLVSGPLKGQPSLDKPMTPEARTVLQGMVGDLFDQFVDLVAAGRHMETGRVRALADGRAYTGRQALKLGLIDEIGGEPEARKWLINIRHVPANLDITEPDHRSWTEKLSVESLSHLVFGATEGLRVDGAWSVWQPLQSRN